MNVRYKHTNIIAKDWRRLAAFYETVFGCMPRPPERHLSGSWIERGSAVPGAEISGIHLVLPGYGADGPTLELFGYAENEPKPVPAANREGFVHIAFEVDDVLAALELVLQHGGGAVGEVVTQKLEQVGVLTFVYATDPEGNIVELQHWD